MQTFKVRYEAPPLSEIVKECEVSWLGGGTPSFSNVAWAINVINGELGKPLITASDIISVEKVEE